MKKRWIFTVISAFAISNAFAQNDVRVKDVATLSGVEDMQLFGYGLVVGLSGTGDRSPTVFTTQSVTNMLKNMGIELPEKQVKVRNVAAVMLTGTLSPFKNKGTRIDVSVSSLGDATSLEGGVLLLTPMQGADGSVYATAQGPIATGGYDVNNRGMTRIKKNFVLVGRVPDGAIVQRDYALKPLDRETMALSLNSPDFTSVVAMEKAINEMFKTKYAFVIARARDAATITLDYSIVMRDSVRNFISMPEFISMVENVRFNAAATAKVVINERTGTIVAGGNVKISEIAVTQGGIKVEIINTPEVVQPQPFTTGSTQIIQNPEMAIDEKEADMVVLRGTTTVSDLAQSLNSLGVTPRDVIAILQAIKEAGALHGQLVIM